MACKFWIILLISMLVRLRADEICSPTVTVGHLDLLKKMIDGQLNITCTIPVQILGQTILEKATPENNRLAEYCYNKGILFNLLNLLDKLNFKHNSCNYNRTMSLRSLYAHEIVHCTTDIDDEILNCLQTTDLTPIQLLERVNDSFLIAQNFQQNSNFDRECIELYKQCNKNDHSTKGSQCSCPSPAALITQKSVSGLSEFKSNTYSTGFPHHSISSAEDITATYLISSAEDITATYPYKSPNPQKNPQDLGPSSVVFTDMSTEKQTLTTIMDHSHYDTTVYPGANTESSRNSMDLALTTTKLPEGITHPLYTTINPSQYNNPLHVSKNPSSSNVEDLLSIRVSPTTEIPSTNTHFLKNGEFIVGTKPDDGKMLETTESDILSQSSNVPISQTYLSKPSKEPSIASSSSSVTKIRRSLVNVDYTSRATVKTPTISTEESGTDLYTSSTYIGSDMSTIEFPQNVLQEKGTEDTNLGWASYYMFSSAAKVSNTGLSTSPPDSEIHSQLAEFPQPHLTTAHKRGYTQYNFPQHNLEVAAFLSNNRENSFAGPNYISNQLPIIETEQHLEGRKKEQNMFITFTVILSIMGLLCLCGLLYYMFQYRLLKRQLHRECDRRLQEERALQIPLTEVVSLP